MNLVRKYKNWLQIVIVNKVFTIDYLKQKKSFQKHFDCLDFRKNFSANSCTNMQAILYWILFAQLLSHTKTEGQSHFSPYS